MTQIKIEKTKGKIAKIECQGHAGFGAKGEDIVCAALSSIVQTASLGLLSVVGININLKRDDKKGYLFMQVPQNLSEIDDIKTQAILETMLVGISDLYQSYSDFIDIEIKGE